MFVSPTASHATTTSIAATAAARLQPAYPMRIRKQLDRVNPITEETLRTKLVDSLPGDRNQSANNPLTGIVTGDAKNGTGENEPLLVISKPKTSCMNKARQMAIVN